MTPSEPKRFDRTLLAEYEPNAAHDTSSDNQCDSRLQSLPHTGVQPAIVAVRLSSAVRPSTLITMNRKVVVGRLNAQDTIPFDPRMSRKHFSIELIESGAFVEDHQSTNGTWLNRKRVQRKQLFDGDQILSGMTVFKVELISKIPASWSSG